MRLSLVIPICNERENLRPLYESLVSVLWRLGQSYEIIFVNDGSTDGSTEALEELAFQDRAVKLVHFRRNFGQTAALAAGIELACGDVIVTIDGDLQNDPADIPLLLRTLDEGYDLVQGWRKNRRDSFLHRRLPSKIANWLIAKVTGFVAHDLGCTLKAMRRELAQGLQLYGEMHRFIPILAHWQGARSTEVVTRHHPRKFGQTKYGIGRTTRVLLDLVAIRFLNGPVTGAVKSLGGFGVLVLALSLLYGVLAGGVAWFRGEALGGVHWLVCGLSGFAGLQCVLLGLLGEFSARLDDARQDKRPDRVRRTVNFGADAAHRVRAA